MQSDPATPLRLVPADKIQRETFSVASRPRLYPNERRRGDRVPIIDQIIHLLIAAAIAGATYWLVSHKLLQSVQVEGRSMAPTLQPTEKYFLNRWIYSMRTPQHDEIIVLKDPQDSLLEVKRIIATAGESVYIKKGAVYLNGVLLKEPYLPSGTRTYAADTADSFVCCGKNQFYVLGDNRNVSRDSRYFGPIRADNIVGKLIQ